jgi:hypothetical protein
LEARKSFRLLFFAHINSDNQRAGRVVAPPSCHRPHGITTICRIYFQPLIRSLSTLTIRTR